MSDHFYVISGRPGSGRSARLGSFLRSGAARGMMPVLVSPLGVEIGNEIPGSCHVVTGPPCQNLDVFSILSVLMQHGQGNMVLGIDDSEHLPDFRKQWTGLLSMGVAMNILMAVVVPDFSSGKSWQSSSVLRHGIPSFPALPFDKAFVPAMSGQYVSQAGSSVV